LFDGDVGNVVANQNKGKAYVTGFTTSYQGKITKHFTTSGFITYTKGKTLDTKEPMSSIPPLFGQFEINYKDEKLAFGANFRFNSKKDIKEYNFREGIDNHDETPIVNPNATNPVDKYYGTPSWFTVGLNSKYELNKNWTLHAKLDNLLDEHYKEFASGVSAPGRNFSISFLADF